MLRNFEEELYDLLSLKNNLHFRFHELIARTNALHCYVKEIKLRNELLIPVLIDVDTEERININNLVKFVIQTLLFATNQPIHYINLPMYIYYLKTIYYKLKIPLPIIRLQII